MKIRPALNVLLLVGGIFSIDGFVFAAIGILYFFFGDRYSVEGSFDDPVKNFYMLTGVFAVMGLLFLAVGMGFVIHEFRKKLRRKALLENGYRIYGTISETYPDKKITINGIHPNYVVCRYEDPVTLRTEFYRSLGYCVDLSGAIGMTVSIYLDSNNHSIYYMDFDPNLMPVKY